MKVTMYDKLLLLPLFQGLGIQELTSIIEKAKFHFLKFQTGNTVVRQGEDCAAILFLLEGQVHREAKNDSQGYTLTETLEAPYAIEPYSLFGMSQTYQATYTAKTDVAIVSIDKKDILNVFSKYEIFRLNYLNLLSNHSQILSRKLCNSCSGKSMEKIINFLSIRCILQTGDKTLKIRMEDLAALIDDTRINVSKELNELKENGLISLGRKEIQIYDMQALTDYIKH